MILVTGATGFVGSHLAKLLAGRPGAVRALVRATSDTTLLENLGVERVVGSLRDENSLRRAVDGADTVMHLAAATRALKKDAFYEVNARGTERLVDALEAQGGGQRLVYLSSMAAMGPSREGPLAPEDEPRPVTTYGRSKLAGERVLEGRDNTAILRAPAVYGPGDRDLLPFFRLARVGVFPLAGSADRDVQLVHAVDLAAATVKAGDSGATGTFHVAEPRAYAWTEVVELVGRAVGRGRGVRLPIPGWLVKTAAAATELAGRMARKPVIFDREKALEILGEWRVDTAATRDLLGFDEYTPLAEGLVETASWYREHAWL